MKKKVNKKKIDKKKKVVVSPHGEVHIRSTFNNIIITLTNKKGEVIGWSSSGKMGFKGSKKNTPYAAQIAAEDIVKIGINAGLKKIDVNVIGPGAGRDSAIRTLNNLGLHVISIKDRTPLPHNGCRPPKRRRV
jgi:small subunit ribosomal protein S11